MRAIASAAGVGLSMRKVTKRWAVSSMLSRMSSSRVASVWMSSRSIGVMNVRSSAWMIRSTTTIAGVFFLFDFVAAFLQAVELRDHGEETCPPPG